MGEQVAGIITIMVLIIAVVAVIALGFGMFTTSNKQSNVAYTDLNTTMYTIQNSELLYYDQKTVTGVELKGFISKAKTADIAILVGTTGMYGLSPKLLYNESAETSLTGQLSRDVAIGIAPFAQLENLQLETSLGTVINNPYVVNYGAVLKNSIASLDESGTGVISSVGVEGGGNKPATSTDIKVVHRTEKYDGTTEFNQALSFSDSHFKTKLDFAVDTTGGIMRYDSALDTGLEGKTMSISDTASFNSYLINNISGDCVGVVFIQEIFN